jgi:imidazolonepropionase-like amidohydrolase
LNVCLGTDSLASNESLDLRAEMREFARAWPAISAEEIIRMVTVNPARVLQGAGRGRKPVPTGDLSVGAPADLIAVPVSGGPYESVVTGTAPVNFVMVEGHVTVG